MMTYIVSQRTRCIGAVAVHASLHAFCSSALAICSGTIEQVLNSSTTHRIQGAAYDSVKNSYNSILPQSPPTTQDSRGLFAGSFVAIGGAA